MSWFGWIPTSSVKLNGDKTEAMTVGTHSRTSVSCDDGGIKLTALRFQTAEGGDIRNSPGLPASGEARLSDGSFY